MASTVASGAARVAANAARQGAQQGKQQTQGSGTHAMNIAKFAGIVMVFNPIPYMYGMKIYQNYDRHTAEHEKVKTGSEAIYGLRAARTDSLKDFKEQYWQQEDNHNYSKTWKRFNDTEVRKPSNYRAGSGSELARKGSKKYRVEAKAAWGLSSQA